MLKFSRSVYRTRTPEPSLLYRSFGLALALAVAAAFPSSGSAQIGAAPASISGRVTDRGNSQGLGGAHVSIIGTTQGTVVRQDGSYRLTLPAGRHVLLINYVGYAPVRDTVEVTAGQSLSKDYALEKGGVMLDAAVVTGTRTSDRTVIKSPVPIDVLTPVEMQQTGHVETSQIIQMLAPSFNFPRPSIADGTDHIRPSTLRGLGPDQVLVLVNGKRRHTSALVNVNGTIGRGSTGADLNAIPSSSIERVEILRDGAAAQYGSDAIAGVINIILKSDPKTEASVEVGSNYTTFDTRSTGSHRFTDGDVSSVDVGTGLSFGGSGFVHVTGQYNNRGSTNRARADKRTQYFPGDRRNIDPSFLTDIHFRQGDAHVNDVAGFVNGALPSFASGAQVYAFGGGSRRKGQGAGNWRLPNGNNTVRAIYPDGFLPLINSTINDVAGTVGLKGDALGWKYDLSGNYGHNSFRFDITNTNNATLGAASPTEFYAGTLRIGQLIGNLDLVRQVAVSAFAKPLNVAIGTEFRRDSYGIGAGEPNSYIDGGFKVLDGPNTGAQPAPGAQVFSGFRPTDASDNSRTNFAGYADLETNPFENLLVGIAGRTEHYSDFGSTTTGKVSSRLDIVRGIALRGALQSGFRAPSLGQEFFASTATNFLIVNGVATPVESRTFPVTSGPAKALGAEPLRAEKSVNRSLGLALSPLPTVSLTADLYNITIRDRIVLSGNFQGAAITTFLAGQGFPGVNGARFFTNAIDTRTKGLDLVGRYVLDMGKSGVTRFTGGYNRTKTKVTRIANTPSLLATQQAVLFDRIEKGRIEVGQPHDNVNATIDHTLNRLNVTAHANRFGKVGFRGDATNTAFDQKFRAKWIADLSATYKLLPELRFTLGADNLFDKYPDEQVAGNSISGNLPYNGISPFGFNGRFVYARLSWGM